ncbi:MAG: AAA family ATPase, partial [Alistipes sp.]|nr:AAA family ATPase [Alistipes sp.]
QLTTLIIVSPEPVSMLPEQLEKVVTVVEVSAPTQEEILEEISRIPLSYEYSTEQQIASIRNEMCRTLQGLQLYEVYQILKSATVRTGGRLSKNTIKLALEEKKQIVKKSGIVEVVDANVQFSEVGGLDVIKAQLEEKREIFQNLGLAVECNLPLPKGILIIGMPGCGKSMIAKSVANLFDMSLLRLDINRLMGQYVGQSEANLRKALETAEAAHPCVLWIDEIEKAFAGSNGSGNSNDMLVMRLMGHFLTWMQERKTPVYIVATANDVMRPEFMRKGRFDEVYFVDFPNAEERLDIFTKKINVYKNSKSGIFDFSQLKSYDNIVAQMVGTTNHGFSGAEIESLVNTVMNKKFIEYIKLKQKKDVKDQSAVPARKITENDFLDEIALMKDAVLSSHTGKYISDYERQREKTSVERIRDLYETYKFTSASKKK